jgi:hypothetical protein
MKSRISIGLLVLAAVACLPRIGLSAVIYNNGSPLLFPAIAQGALFADTGSPFNAAADDFSLAAGSNVIRDIHWWGTYGGTPSDAFSINIYNNNAGTVGSLLTSVNVVSLVRTATGSTINDRAMYAYDAVVSDIVLTPATTYWLGISNTSGGSGSSAWAWVTSANSGNARQFSSGIWGNSTNKALAFNLTNDVPEPSTYVLAAMGVAALLAFKRRKVSA